MPHGQKRVKPELSPERARQIEDINDALRDAAALLQTLTEQRTRIFREMRTQGWRVNELAALAAISPQRMSKILDTNGGSGPRSNKPLWDLWL